MLNPKILEYANNVISRIVAPDEFKARLKNELIKYITKASESTGVDEIINELGSPEELADKMSFKLTDKLNKELYSIFTESGGQDTELGKVPDRSFGGYPPAQNYDRYVHRRHRGEYTCEESNVNIKLLYIPLIQISSGVEKIHYFLTDDDFYDD